MAHNNVRRPLLNRIPEWRRTTSNIFSIDLSSNLFCIAISLVMFVWVFLDGNDLDTLLGVYLYCWYIVSFILRLVHIASLVYTGDSTDFVEQGDWAIWIITLVLWSRDCVIWIFTLVWWLVGCYCLVVRGDMLLQNTPCLYWITGVFLGLNALLMLFDCVCVVKLLPWHLCCLSAENASEDYDVENAGA